MDKVSAATRSRIMSAIVGDELGPELRVASALTSLGVGFKRNAGWLPGRPDFAMQAIRTALFVHGCFWHGCRKHGTIPSSRRPFWESKLNRNAERDAEATAVLERRGWRILVVWEHDTLLGERHLIDLLRRLLA